MIDVPNLDTIAFDALVDEGRGLIPRFAPQWTDHNLHDPGMTLLDLLAWFVDQQVYRIGFVGDAHLAAFAALLGVKPRAAVPARGLLWPHAGATFDQVIEAGWRANPVEQPDLPFAVSRTLHLCPARIERIEARRQSGPRRIRTDENGAILLDADTEALDLTFDPPLVPGDAPISLGLSYAGPLPGTALPPVRIAYRDAGGGWHRALPSWVAAGNGARGAAGAALLAIPPAHGPIGRIRLDLGAAFPRRLLPTRIALNAVPVVQLEGLPDLKIGEGTGWANLERPFDLADGTIPEPADGIRGPAVTTGRDGEAAVPWRVVPDFGKSGPADCDCIIDQARSMILFGNGINGKVPRKGEEIFRGAFDVTRGERGNLEAFAEWAVAHIPGGKPFGRNLDPVAGGSDAWTREDLRAELQRRARRRRAMLKDEELVDAATGLEGFGVERAEALARYLPMLPRHEVPGARTLLLRAASDVDANAEWLDAVAGALAPRRVLGERLAVVTATPVDVDVEAVLLVAAGADQARIRADAEQRLGDRLAAVKRRADQEIPPWPSGRPVTVTELETLVASVDGVAAILSLRIMRKGETPALVSLPLARTEIAVAADIEIRFKVEGG